MAVLPPPTTTTAPASTGSSPRLTCLRKVVAGYAELAAAGRACGQEDRVVLGLEIGQGEVAAHGVVELELHAQTHDPLDFLPNHGSRQAVFGDADGHHAARYGHRLEDGHEIAEAGQVVGGRHSGRSAADDGDLLLAPLLRRDDGRKLARLGRETLEAPNGDGLVQGAASTGRLTRGRTDPAANGRERVD